MDKLVRVSSSRLGSFLELYKGSTWPLRAPTAALILNHINRVKKFPEFEQKTEFLSLSDEPEVDGTIIVKNGSKVYFDTLEAAPFPRLERAVNLMNFESETAFVSIRDSYRPILFNLMGTKKLEKTWGSNTRCFFRSAKFALSLPEFPPPEGFEIKPLTDEHAKELSEEMFGNTNGSLEYVTSLIKYKQSVGIFTTEGELAAWCFGIDYGTLGTQFTKEHFARSGLGVTTVVEMSKKVSADENVDIIWHVAHSNPKAMGIAKKFDAAVCDDYTWMGTQTQQKSNYKTIAPNAKFQVFM
jgi:hypothetical protein